MNYDRYKTADGLPALRMRGQNTDEHEWLAGFEGRQVDLVRVDDRTVAVVAKQLPAAPNEGEFVQTPVVGQNPARVFYDKMTHEDLLTEAARRGINTETQTGQSGPQTLSKTAVIKLLREYDREQAAA